MRTRHLRWKAFAGFVALTITLLAAPVSASAPPVGPTDLRATSVSAGSANLTWNPPSNAGDVYGYSVRDLSLQQVNNQIGWSFGTTATVTLEPDTTYRIAVVATFADTTEESQPSNPITVTTLPDTTAPEAPNELSGRPVSSTSVLLHWNWPSDDVAVDRYVVSDGTRTWMTPAAQGWTTSLVADQLATNTTHRFTVRAKDAAGNLSSPSPQVSVTIENQPPGTPTNLRVVNGLVVWDVPADNSGTIAAYEVVVDGDPDFNAWYPRRVTTNSAPLQAWDDSMMELVPAAGRHTYAVRAVDPSGNVSQTSEPLPVDVP